MQLWTDYEGVTIDGAYPLQELLMPEGRSAFYSTAGPNGEQTVVRVIECHFDEEEILARWRSVQALHHPNFLKFEHFGQTEIDGRPVVYAVLEKVDANLAEVLQRGSLSVEDVTQLGLSLVAALDVLHTHGFIHEHVEPRNIFALNDAVKLRSDCIREAPEEEEGRAAKQRDVRDLVNVLLQGLTERGSNEDSPGAALPKPFSEIIRNGLDGTWGLDNIRAALEGLSDLKHPARQQLETAAPAAAAVIKDKASGAVAEAAVSSKAQLPYLRSNTVDIASSRANPHWLVAVGALLVVLVIWFCVHTRYANRTEMPRPAAASQMVRPVTQLAQQTSTNQAPQPSAVSALAIRVPALASSRAGWRVIAFTYNGRVDAEKKASSIARAHPELEPAVFTPSGRSPYLVCIGGIMDQQTARGLALRSRSLGLPHDMYAQNYSR